MKKVKKINATWKGFLVNMLGVILAIVLTFGVNSLWMRHDEKKKTTEMLILVRNELRNNKEWFKSQEEAMKRDGYVYQKIFEAKDDLKSIPADTLALYFYQLMHFDISQLTSTAWQIFQNSEMIQKMSNKELLIRLTNCYIKINTLYESIIKDYWDTKKKMMSLFVDAVSPHDFFDKVLKNNEYAFFYYMFRLEQVGLWEIFPKVDAIIDYSILLLDKHGEYKYDMEEKDNEYESFIEARADSVRLSRIDSLQSTINN